LAAGRHTLNERPRLVLDEPPKRQIGQVWQNWGFKLDYIGRRQARDGTL
jgi:hypothetical protein